MKKRLIIVSVLVTMLAMLPAATGSATEGTVELSFDKELVDPIGMIWEGTVDASGSIQTVLTSLTPTGNVWHVEFDWSVLNPDFTAEVAGIINLKTGLVVLNGKVIDGLYEGSRIHVEARIDLTDLSSEGSMLITP